MTTLATEARIGEALNRLAIARGGQTDDTTSEVYLDRLCRYQPDLVERACREWSDVPRAAYETTLPSVGVLIETIERIGREDAARAAQSKLLLMAPGRDEPTYHCISCYDEPAAWRTAWCPGQARPSESHCPPGMTSYPCGRPGPHPSHTYSSRCSCSETNPVIARHRQFAQVPTVRRRPRKTQW